MLASIPDVKEDVVLVLVPTRYPTRAREQNRSLVIRRFYLRWTEVALPEKPLPDFTLHTWYSMLGTVRSLPNSSAVRSYQREILAENLFCSIPH